MRNPIQAMLESQVTKFQESLAGAMEELQQSEITGSAGGGAVRARMTGDGKLLDVEIAAEVVDPQDVELLQDLVCAALRDALAKTAELKREKIMSATPLGAMGIDVPDIF